MDVLPPPGAKFGAGTVPHRPTADVPGRAAAGRRVRPPEPAPGADAADLLVPRTSVPEVAPRYVTMGYPPCRPLGVRGAPGRGPPAAAGLDTDHRTLPHETGWLATAVHLDKGCYRGQETVARVHHLGRPPRRLVLLHLDGITTDAPAGARHRRSQRRRSYASAFVGTAVRHHELGQVALALVKRNVPDGAILQVNGVNAAVDLGTGD